MSKVPIKTVVVDKPAGTPPQPTPNNVPIDKPAQNNEPVPVRDDGDYRRKNMEKAREQLKRKRENSQPMILEESMPINNGQVITRVEQYKHESSDDSSDEEDFRPSKKRKISSNNMYPVFDTYLDHLWNFGSVVVMSVVTSLCMGLVTVATRTFIVSGERQNQEDVTRWTRNNSMNSSFIN